jgi:hypothetical protein
MRDIRLPLRRTRNQVVPEEHTIRRGGVASVRTINPISIRVSNEICNRGAM